MVRFALFFFTLPFVPVTALEEAHLASWPVKNGNTNRTGQAWCNAPVNLSQPSWVWEEPDRPRKSASEPLYCTPTLDANKNIYIPSSTGRSFALNQHGDLLWMYSSTGLATGNLALHSGTLFSASDDGFAFALEAQTGKEIWRARIDAAAPSDAYSPLVVQDLIILPACSNASDTDGNDRVVAVNVADGRKQWTYTMPGDLKGENFMPAEFEDSIVFPDRAGGLYRLRLRDGSEVWRKPPPAGYENSTCTGGMALGPNAVAYVASNKDPNMGMPFAGGFLRAFHLQDGAELWSLDVDGAGNAAPAVGKVAGHDVLAVVVGLGADPGFWINGTVEARNALTGDLLWVFGPIFGGMGFCAGFTDDDQCWPDLFGVPSIGADGTVYVNWSGGWAYALRDANGDGRVELSDPEEVSGYFHGEGTNGQSAIAPGFLVAPSCWKIIAFGAEPRPDPQPDPKGGNIVLIIAIACAVVAVLIVGAATYYYVRDKAQLREARESLREASLQPRA